MYTFINKKQNFVLGPVLNWKPMKIFQVMHPRLLSSPIWPEGWNAKDNRRRNWWMKHCRFSILLLMHFILHRPLLKTHFVRPSLILMNWSGRKNDCLR